MHFPQGIKSHGKCLCFTPARVQEEKIIYFSEWFSFFFSMGNLFWNLIMLYRDIISGMIEKLAVWNHNAAAVFLFCRIAIRDIVMYTVWKTFDCYYFFLDCAVTLLERNMQKKAILYFECCKPPAFMLWCVSLSLHRNILPLKLYKTLLLKKHNFEDTLIHSFNSNSILIRWWSFKINGIFFYSGCIYMYIYTYIYMHRERERERERLSCAIKRYFYTNIHREREKARNWKKHT